MRPPFKVTRDLMIVAVLALSVTLGHSVQGYAQEKQDQSKDDETITLKIVKDENGKVTVFDTTYTKRGKGEREACQYQYIFRDLDQPMAEMEAQMLDSPIPPQWEALLQSIPMGRITGFKVKDRNDGKRIIIDVDDNYPFVLMEPFTHRNMNHGGKKIMIERQINHIPPPPPPPPPPADQKESAPKPDKG